MSPARTPRRRRTAAAATVAEVRLWDTQVGAVSEDANGTVTFEFDPAFAATGWDISPLLLPVARTRGPVQFPELARLAAFRGLPGVLADALPDAFGNAIITRYFAEQGRPDAALSPVQQLLYIGTRAMGALEFHPATFPGRTALDEEALALVELVAQARRVIEGDTRVAIPEIMRVGATAGGARAKAVVLWNRTTNIVRSGYATPQPGDEAWLVKFDGVSGGQGGHTLESAPKPGPWTRIEHVYTQMAEAAGIAVSPGVALIPDGELLHLAVRRFDRPTPTARLHLHSLAGLTHTDYNIPQAFSYEQWFDTIRALALGADTIAEAYRRMVFNVAARNQDDHVKNQSFLMDRTGAWTLAPAYDLIFAAEGRWASRHQMTVAGKSDDITRDDLLAIGRRYDLPRNGALVIDAVRAALAEWPERANAVGLAPDIITDVQSRFRQLW